MDGWTDEQFLAQKKFRQLKISGKMLYTSTYSCYQSFIGTLACLKFSQTIISSNHPSKIHDPAD